MELIPVFSLIVLVATIATFILAVGAYILFKIRERRGGAREDARDAAFEAEIVAPAPYVMSEVAGGPMAAPPARREYAGDPHRPRYTSDRPSSVHRSATDDMERSQ